MSFSYAGCTERMTRQSMPEHIAQSLALHMSLQSTSHQQELKELKEEISDLQEQCRQSRAEVAELNVSNNLLLDKLQESKSQVAIVGRDLKAAQEQRFKGHLNTLRGEIKRAQADTKQEISKQMKSDFEYLHSHIGLIPFTCTMNNFELKKLVRSTPWHSPSFYTHPHGYKMCLGVYANGYSNVENSHVTVFVCMMKGDYDDQLKWPFRGDITIQILNQTGNDEGHCTKIVHVTGDKEFGEKVVVGDRSEGLGYHEFLPHTRLIPHYLKNDCLCLCVKEVKIKYT